MTIDYRKLLIKYMMHVAQEEGTMFVNYKPDHINLKEWKELEKIDKMNYEQMKSQFS